MSHTELPWELDGNGHIYSSVITGQESRTATPYGEANAEFIVKACNNHEKLIKALEPFTHPDLAEILGGKCQGDDSPVFVRNKAMLKIGDFKRAIEAIKEAEK